MTEQNIVLDKDYFEELMAEYNEYLMTKDSEFFYLPMPIAFTHLVSKEQATITNIPFIYTDKNYFIVHNITKSDGSTIEVCPTITHVNISRNRILFRCGGLLFEAYHFCAGDNLNCTPPEKHFGNQELIKMTLAMILPDQNPSNAYFRADNYLGIINPELALRCSQCDKPIPQDASIIELITRRCGAHVTEQTIEDISPNMWYVKFRGRSRYEAFNRYESIPLTEVGSYRIITPEEVQEELKKYVLNIDSIFVGCGSAGSNIGTQLARTDLISNGILIDFDNVENKNLRNQAYLSRSCGYRKSEQLADTMRQCKGGYYASNPFKYRVNKVEDLNLDRYKAKYLFNCVDSLTARLHALEKTQSRYIIDTRYHGLDCTILFVDTEDEEQMKYYKDGLEQAIQTFVKDVSVPKDLLTPSNCNRWSNIRRIPSLRNKSYSMLKKYTDKFYNSIPLDDKERLLHILDKERQTCNSPNIIDIYSISAGIVVGMLRELENGNKLFTHLELTTQNAIPQTMIVRE